MSVHIPCGSSRPWATFTQRPGDPESPQVLQAPWQALSQQKPSTQKSDRHSSGFVQLAPIGFLPQEPATQVFGGTHCASDVQVVAQALPEHWKGPQSTWLGAWQVPWPSQVPGVLATLPLQVGGEQVVSAS